MYLNARTPGISAGKECLLPPVYPESAWQEEVVLDTVWEAGHCYHVGHCWRGSKCYKCAGCYSNNNPWLGTLSLSF